MEVHLDTELAQLLLDHRAKMGARKDQLFGIQSSHQQGVNNVTCVVRSGQNLSINSFKNENQMRLCLAHLV